MNTTPHFISIPVKGSSRHVSFLVAVLTIILSNLGLTLGACTCRGITDYYAFYKSTDLFIGKVVSVTDDSKFIIYHFKVLDKLNGNFSDLESIYTSKQGMCQFKADIGVTYLVQANRIHGLLRAGFCSYLSVQGTATFSEDSTLIKQFMSSTFTVNCQHFIGQVKDKMRQGKWILYDLGREEGLFIDDKKHGVWTSGEASSYYQHGKWQYTEFKHQLNDEIRVKIIRTDKSETMYYPEGGVWKIMTNKEYTVFYPNGTVKERAALKRGFVKSTWTKYSLNGKLEKRIKWEYPDSPEADRLFYSTEEPTAYETN